MSKPAQKCIFCDKGGMSKAHILPDWLGKELLPEERTSHHLEQTGHFETFTTKAKSPPPTSKIKQGDSGTKKVRKVCTRCNSGWMGDLETPVRPHILALMNGADHTLDGPAQTLLATWFALVTTLYDAINLKESAIPQVDRDYLKQHRAPPLEWQIWLAKYGGGSWQDHRFRRMVMRISEHSAPISDDLSCNTQATTLVLRQLCAHVYSSTVMPLAGYKGVSLIKLWPLAGSDIIWRNAPLLDDARVVNLAESLPRELPS